MDQRLGSSSTDVLRLPVRGGWSLTTAQRSTIDLSQRIPGWGADLDPARRPGVPRDKAPDIGIESLYPDIVPQRPTFRIHKSTEHARLTPVFGTSCPPHGLSGSVRDLAYRASEGRLSRWVGLLLADRIDVVESTLRDFRDGRPPNLVREMGLQSGWRHDRNGMLRKAAVAGFVLASAAVLLSRRRRRR
jgi:hypothetical protein